MKNLKKTLNALVLGVGLSVSGASFAIPMNLSFTGTFANDADVQLFNFTANGASTVTLQSYSYGGGVQADGNVVSAGGFDTILTLFDSLGNFINSNDDFGGATDPNTGAAFDAGFSSVIAAGDYIVALTQFNNFVLGDLSDGFGQVAPNFTAGFGCSNGQFCDVTADNRTNAWAFDVLGVEAVTVVDDDFAPVPEPGTMALFALGVVGVALRKKATR